MKWIKEVFFININNNEPLYINIMNELKRRIINGIYPVGNNIPTEVEFEKEFEVSKITIRKAIELLVTDGYLEKQSGKGTSVISNAIFNKLSKAESFSSILNREGLNLEKKNIKFEPVILEESHSCYEYFGRFAYKLERTYFLNNEPYLYIKHYLAANLKINNSILSGEKSLYHIIYENGIEIDEISDEFDIQAPDEFLQKELNLNDDEKVIVRERIVLDKNKMPVEISFASYNTKKHKYIIKYQV